MDLNSAFMASNIPSLVTVVNGYSDVLDSGVPEVSVHNSHYGLDLYSDYLRGSLTLGNGGRLLTSSRSQ